MKLFRNAIICFLVLALSVALMSCGARPDTALDDTEVEEPTTNTEPQLTETKAEATPKATEAPKPSETPAPTEEPKTTEAPVEAPAATPAPTAQPAQTGSGSGSSGNSGSTGGSTAPATPAPTQKPAETHTHSWTQQTKTVHHDEVTEQVKIVDVAGTDGWDEQIPHNITRCQCGAEFATNEAWAAHSTAMRNAYVDAHDGDPTGFTGHCGCSNHIWYETVHHEGTPEQSHYETRVVKAAYDETVVTGYTCACGATKAA